MKLTKSNSERQVMAMELVRGYVRLMGRWMSRSVLNPVILKKTLSMVIVTCLMVNLMPVGAFAEDPISQQVINDKEKKTDKYNSRY